jgi:hypothetical protein
MPPPRFKYIPFNNKYLNGACVAKALSSGRMSENPQTFMRVYLKFSAFDGRFVHIYVIIFIEQKPKPYLELTRWARGYRTKKTQVF